MVLALNPGETINIRHKLDGDVQESQLLLVGVWRTNGGYSDDLCESRVQSGSDPVSCSFIEPAKIGLLLHLGLIYCIHLSPAPYQDSGPPTYIFIYI